MPPDDAPPPAVVDPFGPYRFRLWWDGREVAGFAKVSGLTKQPSTVRRIPVQTDYQPVVLERGATDDVAFDQWANLMWSYPSTEPLGDEGSLADFRMDVQLEVYDPAGDLALRFTIPRCWPSSYTALPELAAEADTVAIARLTLEHEGWTRDDLTPPAAP